MSLRPRFLPDRDAAREWGGKGAPLARMIRAGYPVPPTACFGLSAVRTWLESLPEYRAALPEWSAWSAEAPRALARLRGAIEEAGAPEDWPRVGATLRASLVGDQLWPMILRSSMSAEDGAEESFAGCFESVRAAVPTDLALWQAFTRVVASAFTETAAQRTLAAGLEPEELRTAVVVQPLLEAELAGVCFSRDPSNPWSSDGRAEWVRGDGEALVQGTAQAEQRRRSEGPAPGTGSFWDALWKRADQAEKIVGGPADLEWVWDGEQLWFVQARPIATPEARLAALGARRRWSRALTLERFPEPVSPMGWSSLQDALVGNLESLDRRFGVVAKRPEEMAVAVRGTVYSDPEFFSFPRGVRIRWLRYLAPWKPASWNALGALARYAGRILVGRGGAVSRALFKLDLAEAILGGQAAQIERSWAWHRDGGVAELKRYERTLRPGMGAAELLARMEELKEIATRFMEPDLAVYLIKEAYNQALLAIWRALGYEETGFADLFRSFDGNRTLEMNHEWSDLVAALSGDPGKGEFLERLAGAHDFESGLSAGQALAPAAGGEWTKFLERNGHSTTSWDIATPTWADDPAALKPLLEASAQAGARRAPEARSGLREQARAKLFGALALKRVARAVERLEAFMRIDEEHHFLSGMLLVPSRRLVLDAGAILAEQGLIAEKSDVFFLTIGELKGTLARPARTLRFVAQRRRSEWERARGVEPPFELPAAQAAAAAEPGGSGWKGLPMSPGSVVGRVRIAEHIEQARGIEPGTILVTTSPNPALTPIYPLLGGLVTATGSSLSHGFVSAREYSLPAVSGIPGITRMVREGDLVRVDGSTGKVEVLEGESA